MEQKEKYCVGASYLNLLKYFSGVLLKPEI